MGLAGFLYPLPDAIAALGLQVLSLLCVRPGFRRFIDRIGGCQRVVGVL